MAAIDLAQRRLLNKYQPDPERSYNLPARYYTDPEIFEREKEAIFFKTWQFVGHVEDLPEPGCYITTRIFDQNVVIIRGKDGRLRAFYNVCSHRAHELLEGSGKEAKISCPYHGWTYELDGGLFSARGSEKVKGFEPSEFCLKTVRLEVFLNLIFVNLDPDAPSLESQTGALAEEIRDFVPDLDNLTKAHRCTFELKGNWKNVADNFLECYHCPIGHPAFADMIDMASYRTKTYGIYSSHLSRSRTKHKGKAYDFDPSGESPVGCFWFLWPNLAINIFPGTSNIGVFQFIPAGPELTYETFDLYLRDKTPTPLEREMIDYFEQTLNPEDISLVESVQRGLHSKGYHQGRYVVDAERTEVSEHALHHFHGLVLDALEGTA
ncbi:MAG: aromatic ring-hydroxylating dioxygenase subunit alpha [Alphaproteobacteria bacterium]